MEYTYLITTIKQLKNLLKYDTFKSSRKIEKVQTIEKSQREIINVIQNDKANNEYCILKVKSNYETIFNKKEFIEVKNNLEVIYFMMKNDEGKMELIPFNHPKNQEYVNIILKYK